MIIGVPLINGVEYTHADIVFELFGLPVIGMTAIDYSDPQDITLNYGTGNVPVSRGFGQVKPTASVTLTMKEVQRITASAPFGKIQNIPNFSIGINFLTEAGDYTRHRLINCRFMGRNPNSSVGNSQIEEKLELSVADINYNAA